MDDKARRLGAQPESALAGSLGVVGAAVVLAQLFWIHYFLLCVIILCLVHLAFFWLAILIWIF